MRHLWIHLLLSAFLGSAAAQGQRSLRVITWNVGDNKGMKGRFDEKAVKQVLGLEALGKSVKAYFDIYAISIQENCHFCDSDNFHRLADIFVQILNKENRFHYAVVDQMATRVSRQCEFIACGTGQHGSTHIIVIAKRGMASSVSKFHTNKCMGGWLKNAEKGIAAVNFQIRGSNRNICVAGLHLDSKEASERRECFQKFAEENASFLNNCHVMIFAGDFNTRTGDKGGIPGALGITVRDIMRFMMKDEMSGPVPYGGKNLKPVIDHHLKRYFKEVEFSFQPTYSVVHPNECENYSMCYRRDRPPSWADRILYDGCEAYDYFSLPIYKSDHMPVVGIYLV